MALDPTVKLRIEKIILDQLGEEFRRLNLSYVANKVDVDQSTVSDVARSMIEHGRIEPSPIKRYWYRLIAAHPEPLVTDIDLILANQARLEYRISQLESRLSEYHA